MGADAIKWTDALDIAHEHLACPLLDDVAEALRAVDVFSRGQRRVERGHNPRVADQVVVGDRLLNPGQVELLKLAADPNGVVDIPALVGVNHQRHARSDCLSDDPNCLQIVRHASATQSHLDGDVDQDEHIAE